ncbi:MAG: hypothetical protein CVV49_10360 [Spirochaetae bacterium HGW-Spirochaetae-5]|nr:MAG: hypothetical protein CVV49_10360 [Spirochaetae bacterium HGW-Spirochaetae-5]
MFYTSYLRINSIVKSLNEKNIIRKPLKTLIILYILCCFTTDLTAADTVISDPDHISTGIEYRGTPNIRLGDTFSYAGFTFGGMADIRNESRFNQGVLPNHNWRGFVFLYYDKSLTENKDLLKVTGGFEHESAHPTMGLNDGNDKAYDKVYDSTYRNINLNSLMLRLSSTSGSRYALTLLGDIQFYFSSRNTPELPINELTWSEGISGGFEFRYPAGSNCEFFISGFDRYIFQSRYKTEGNIYYDTDSGALTRMENYPVINNTNTVSAKAGFIFSSLIQDRQVSLYCGILYGNIFGFVDSREKRTVYSIGMEIFH